MSNHLSMSNQQAIIGLIERGWSQHRIARELELDRKTVRRHVRLNQAAKSPIPTTGSAEPNSPISTAGSALGRKSHCEAVAVQIQEALEVGLSAQRIYQDLVAEQQFAGSYESVKRFVRRLGAVTPLPFRRMECEPAQQVQVDFGKGAWVLVDGKRTRPHLFRIVLSHSRKAYSEVVWRQATRAAPDLDPIWRAIESSPPSPLAPGT